MKSVLGHISLVPNLKIEQNAFSSFLASFHVTSLKRIMNLLDRCYGPSVSKIFLGKCDRKKCN